MLDHHSDTSLKVNFFKARCDAAANFRIKDQIEMPKASKELFTQNYERLVN